MNLLHNIGGAIKKEPHDSELCRPKPLVEWGKVPPLPDLGVGMEMLPVTTNLPKKRKREDASGGQFAKRMKSEES